MMVFSDQRMGRNSYISIAFGTVLKHLSVKMLKQIQ